MQKHILSWEQLLEVGHDLPETRLDDRLHRIAINHCCTLVYASPNHSSPSSCSVPRGVMLSHDNLTWCSKMLLGALRAPGFNRLPAPGEEVILSFLPAHASLAAHCVDTYYSLSIAGTVVFAEANGGNSSGSSDSNVGSAADLVGDSEAFFEMLAEAEPTVFIAPPEVSGHFPSQQRRPETIVFCPDLRASVSSAPRGPSLHVRPAEDLPRLVLVHPAGEAPQDGLAQVGLVHTVLLFIRWSSLQVRALLSKK